MPSRPPLSDVSISEASEGFRRQAHVHFAHPSYTDCSSTRDYSHVVDAPHVSFVNLSTGTHSSVSMKSADGIDQATQGLLPSSMGCSRCAQISGIRDSLKKVEASYLEEIAHLKRIVSQIDEERISSVNRAEQSLLAFDRIRQQGLSKDHEIQSLHAQLRQLEDKLHRSEYELASEVHTHRRDVAFYNRREFLLLTESESRERAEIASADVALRSAFFAAFTVAPCRMSPRICGIAPPSPRSSLGLTPSPEQRAPRRSPSVPRGGPLSGSRGESEEPLRRQLAQREETVRRLSREVADERQLTREMQAEMDDMMRTELHLAQRCGRSGIEAEEARGYADIVSAFISAHLCAPVVCPNDPKVSGDMCGAVSRAVEEALERALGGHLSPLRHSVERICSAADEIRGAAMQRAAASTQEHTERSETFAEMARGHDEFIAETRQALRQIEQSAASAIDRTGAEIAATRNVLKKSARLTSHNGKILDDKLNDILSCQAAIARQVIIAAAAAAPTPLRGNVRDGQDTPIGRGEVCVQELSPQTGETGRSKTNSHSSSFEDPLSVTRRSMLPSHVWDVVESDDESIPPLPTLTATRKTPYDIEDV